MPILLALINLRLVLALVSWPDDPSAKEPPSKLSPLPLCCCAGIVNGLAVKPVGAKAFPTGGLGWPPKLKAGPAGVEDCWGNTKCADPAGCGALKGRESCCEDATPEAICKGGSSAMLSSIWFSAFASLATAQLGEDPKGDPKFADANTGVDEDSDFAPKEKGFAAEEPLATPKENPLLGAAPKDPNAKVLVVEEVDGAPNEKVEKGGLGPRFAEAPNPDPKREGTGEGWAATPSEKPPKAWLLVPCTAMAGVLDAPVDVGRVVKLLDPNAELVVVPNTEIGPLNASKWFGVLPEARGEGAIVVLVAGFERAVVGTAKPKGKGAGAAKPTVNTEAEELMPWPTEGVAKSACDGVELELAAEELPDINPPAPNNVEVEEIGDIVVNPKATPADRVPVTWSRLMLALYTLTPPISSSDI